MGTAWPAHLIGRHATRIVASATTDPHQRGGASLALSTADPDLLKLAQAIIQGDCAVVEGPHGERPGERLDSRQPRVTWRKLRAQDHPLRVLPDEVGGDFLGGGPGSELGERGTQGRGQAGSSMLARHVTEL